MATAAAYPVAARDALYRLFAAALRSPDEAPRAYLSDRLARQLVVLEERKRRRSAGGDPFRELVQLGASMFNAGLFFDCHEFLEDAWRGETGDRKLFLQGLIQAAAALHKLELSPSATAGALEGFKRGRAKLERTAGLVGFAPGALAPLAEIEARLASGRPSLDALPKLELA